MHCRSEFELEQMTKQYVRHRVVRVQVPAHVSARISQQLAIQSTQKLSFREWLEELLPAPSWKTSFAAGGIVVAVLAVILTIRNFPHSHTQPADSNIIHQSFNYFDSVLKGQLVPTVASNDPVQLESALSPNVNFEVYVPRLKRCRLVGGLFTNYNNEKIAHVIYQNDNKLIYLYQTCFDAVEERGVLNLPPKARAELKQTGWYFENHLDDCSLIVWLDGSTVCAALADMNREELLECLKDIQ
jgi:anti-sigma factor RsiW